MPGGAFTGTVSVTQGPFEGRHGWWALVETSSSHALADFANDPGLRPGSKTEIVGISDGKPGVARSRPYAARIRVRSFELADGSVLSDVGGSVSGHVMRRLEPYGEGRGLLAGFLIGDVSHVSDSDVEAMRLSGLSHFVAVSGSNVALFLLLVFVLSGPLALGPKRRAVIGLLAIPVYAAATRFEPSVMRASLMAAVAFGGRLVGIGFDAWQLLSVTVVILLVSDPYLAGDVGFQLSVAATAGVLVGAKWPLTGGVVQRALAVTVAAQLSVAPLLMAHFGTIPLLSPVLNLLAAPLVTAATAMGALGVAGPEILIDLASVSAGLVLAIARMGSGFPQVGFLGGLAAGLAGLVILRWRSLAPAAALLAAVWFGWATVVPAETAPPGSVVVLDVGQGDAILINGGEGRWALVDGGPDPVLLRSKLRSYGVAALDIVVLTHIHADHVLGLIDVVRTVPVGQILMDTEPHQSELVTEFLAAADGVAVRVPSPGESHQLGELTLEILGPLRRYASPNDQSIVIEVRGVARSMLLAGDIETFAQADLPARADVLKVPHQGAATSDPAWLQRVGAELAVISVGPNQFGHPEPWVTEVLEEAGAEVVRTDEAGDVVVPLS